VTIHQSQGAGTKAGKAEQATEKRPVGKANGKR
jgi:hypothetical protein